MRRVRYNVAASLDGFIADRNGGYGWIPNDPEVDFGSLFRDVDAILCGRKTYEQIRATGGGPWGKKVRTYVFSRSLVPRDLPGVTLVSGDAGRFVDELRKSVGGDIWLFGGGELFASLLEEGVVDSIEVTIVPVLLGGGVRLLAEGAPLTRLHLVSARTYPSGMVTLSYGTQSATKIFVS